MALPFLKTSIGTVLRAMIAIVLLLPVWMFIYWLASPKKKLVVAIIDKTVLTQKGQEHVSLNWVLNQEKYAKNNSDLYRRNRDYFGFFPLDNEKYQIKGLERFNNDQLDQLGKDADVAYITDAYGIYKNDWYSQAYSKERSGIIYGGMSEQDLYFLSQMQDNHKLIITEFNCLASPTSPIVRSGFENKFGIHWSGWTGRYFDSFDSTVNKELPKWLINNYKKRHGGTWPFKRSGVALINSEDDVVILENETHLTNEFPRMISNKEGQGHYGLPDESIYTFWFDIVEPDSSFNHTLATFLLSVNENGKKELAQFGIPAAFPAITAHVNKDYRFFYFSADFADNPIGLASSYFKGVYHFKWFIYNNRDPQGRKSFFWKIYLPLVTNILNDYYQTIKPIEAKR